MGIDRDRLEQKWQPERAWQLLPAVFRSSDGTQDGESGSADTGERVLATALRKRVPATGLDGRVSTAAIGSRVSDATPGEDLSLDGIGERVPTTALRNRVSDATPDEDLSLDDIGERVSETDLRGRVSTTALRSRVSDATPDEDLSLDDIGERVSETDLRGRLSAPEIDQPLSAPPVEVPDSDDIVDRDRIERQFYDTQTTTPEFFVGVIPADHETVSERLQDSEFGVSRVTYPKTLHDEDVEYVASSIWVYRSWPLSHFQLHVPLFEVEDDGETLVYVFYHHEYNWLRHPARHLDAEYLNPEWGRNEIVDLIEAADLPLETCPDIDGEYDRAAEYCATCGDNT